MVCQIMVYCIFSEITNFDDSELIQKLNQIGYTDSGKYLNKGSWNICNQILYMCKAANLTQLIFDQIMHIYDWWLHITNIVCF